MPHTNTRMPFYTAFPLTFIYHCVLIFLTVALLVAFGMFVMWDHPVEVWNDIRNIPPTYHWVGVRAALLLSAFSTLMRLWDYYSE